MGDDSLLCPYCCTPLVPATDGLCRCKRGSPDRYTEKLKPYLPKKKKLPCRKCFKMLREDEQCTCASCSKCGNLLPEGKKECSCRPDRSKLKCTRCKLSLESACKCKPCPHCGEMIATDAPPCQCRSRYFEPSPQNSFIGSKSSSSIGLDAVNTDACPRCKRTLLGGAECTCRLCTLCSLPIEDDAKKCPCRPLTAKGCPPSGNAWKEKWSNERAEENPFVNLKFCDNCLCTINDESKPCPCRSWLRKKGPKKKLKKKKKEERADVNNDTLDHDVNTLENVENV